uniref:Chromosome 8 open reading frame 74 n=1 Tax=Terrapene triunguis TaxID=2587831 RepID=A0A674JX83_9SAUR
IAILSEGNKRLDPCTPHQGRQCLRELLRWEEFDDVRDLRRSIELDSLYSSIVFAMEKGLSWPAVVEAGKLAEELLNETKGLPVSQAICVLKDKLVACEPKLSPFKPCVLCEYFHHTLIRHYQLYQFVLCRERDVEQTSAHLEICAPPQPLPLMAGIDAEVWHYQQQLGALSAAEVQKRTNMLLLRETLHLEREHMLQRADAINHIPPVLPLALQILETLVKEVIGTQIQALHEILQTEIQTTFEILELRLQKRALSLNPPVPYPPPPPLEERTKKSTKAQEQKKKKK